MAFVFAGLIEVLTIFGCLLVIFANGMSAAPSMTGTDPKPVFVWGTIAAAVVASSHWWIW